MDLERLALLLITVRKEKSELCREEEEVKNASRVLTAREGTVL